MNIVSPKCPNDPDLKTAQIANIFAGAMKKRKKEIIQPNFVIKSRENIQARKLRLNKFGDCKEQDDILDSEFSDSEEQKRMPDRDNICIINQSVTPIKSNINSNFKSNTKYSSYKKI